MNRRVIIGSAGVVVIGLALWGAWKLDARSAPGRSSEIEGAEFSYKLPEDQSDANSDVLIKCDEDVIEKPVNEFAKWKGLSGMPLSVPGGPMLVARANDITLSEHLKPAQRAAIEMLKRYSPRRIVLVGHEMCLHYDTIAAYNNALAEVRERQMSDMNVAIKLLREWFPRAEVTGYMVEEKDRTLFFRPVAATQ